MTSKLGDQVGYVSWRVWINEWINQKIERTNKWMNERMNAGLKFCEFLDLKLQMTTEYLTFQEFKQNNNNRPFTSCSVIKPCKRFAGSMYPDLSFHANNCVCIHWFDHRVMSPNDRVSQSIYLALQISLKWSWTIQSHENPPENPSKRLPGK